MPFVRLLAMLALAGLGLFPLAAGAGAMEDVRQRLSLPAGAQLRAWPGIADRTIVAFAIPHAQAEADKEQGVDYLDLTIEVVRTSTAEVVARLLEENGIVSDAMHFDGLAIDTADYTLAPGVRAFGLRFRSSHAGMTDADIVDMRLFEVRGSDIVEVMPTVAMHVLSQDRGCNDSHETTRTLEVSGTRTRGRADIVLHGLKVDAPGVEAGGDCKRRTTQSSERVILRYDGKSYPLPKGFY